MFVYKNASVRKDEKGLTITQGPLDETDKHWGMRSKSNLLKKLEKQKTARF